MASLDALDFGYEAWLVDDPNGSPAEELPADEIYIEKERHYVHSARPLAEIILHRGSIGTAHFWRGVIALSRLSEPVISRVLLRGQWIRAWEPAGISTHPAGGATTFRLFVHGGQRLPTGRENPATAEAGRQFFELAAKMRSPDFMVDPELAALGEKAAARLKQTASQDVEEWAHHLADDLGKLKD